MNSLEVVEPIQQEADGELSELPRLHFNNLEVTEQVQQEPEGELREIPY